MLAARREGAGTMTSLKTHQQHVDDQMAHDPGFRRNWERTALARAVAIAVIDYRATRALTQTALGHELGMSQPQVARIESGDVNPTIDTLMKLSGAIGMEVTIDVRPAGREPRLATPRARAAAQCAEATSQQATVLVAAIA